MKKVSLVIINWNRPKDTLACLRSVEKSQVSKFKLQIIVIDNNSSDNSVELIIKELTRIKKKSGITSEIIVNDKNLGFAEGNNVGIRHAINHAADYVLLLNNDTAVDRNMIKNLVEEAKKHPLAGIISPKIYFAKGYEFHKKRYRAKDKGKVIWYAGGRLDWKNVYGTNVGVDEVDKGQFEKTEKTGFGTGACLFLSSKAIKEVGYFNANYFMYFEDVELSVRMKDRGWRVLYTPNAHLWHKVAQSSKIGSDLNDYYITRNRLLFGMRYADIRARFALYKESLRFLLNGRKWQKIGVRDFYLRRLGKGSWK